MNSRPLLLSIAPEFSEKIASGLKTVELRRRFPQVPSGTWVYFYVTLPVGAVIGRAQIEQIDADILSSFWKRYQTKVGTSKRFFDDYFEGRTQGVAILLGNYEATKPVSLKELRSMRGFTVPQSFRYLDKLMQQLLEEA